MDGGSMSKIIPPTKPRIKEADVRRFIDGLDELYPLVVLAIRGYYKRTMGNPRQNDIGIYDDCIVAITPDSMLAVNGNTDPSTLKKGRATLVTGWWMDTHCLDTHRGKVPHRAICQRLMPVTVDRYLVGKDTGMFGINLHRGGRRTTSSEGCLTVPPDQWDAFIAFCELAMQGHPRRTPIPIGLFGVDTWEEFIG